MKWEKEIVGLYITTPNSLRKKNLSDVSDIVNIPASTVPDILLNVIISSPIECLKLEEGSEMEILILLS